MRTSRNRRSRLAVAPLLAAIIHHPLPSGASAVGEPHAAARIVTAEDGVAHEPEQRHDPCGVRCERRTAKNKSPEVYEHLAEAAVAAHSRLLDTLTAALTAHLSARAEAPVRIGERFDLARPVPGRIGSPFGPRLHPILHEIRPHRGVDLSATSGTPVRAAGPGRVVRAGNADAYGLLVAIDHGNGTETRYAHLSEALVRPDEPVTRGQIIGKVGSTGLSTGPHLHFELRVDGTAVDPAPWLPA